ncbi:MAG: serine/threonine protein kinase, partial [Actinobacteria bacterium]|nr:serine/threonine protein kinase [Actinomycetota bacterium]
MIGRVFDDRYEVGRKLGSGGMADVYLANDRLLGRQVALKVLSGRYANDEQFVERFRREASSAASLNHPNIVQIYDRGEAEGTYYIAMEYLDGRSLKEIIVRYAPLAPDLVLSISTQIVEALRFAHRRDVIHRDIKPQNIIVDNDGRVKVTDFGIARAGSASTMTEAGSILGTAHYLSPEQAKGQPVEAASDLYSLGVVMYEMVTGKLPFNGDNPVSIAMQ